MSMYESLVERYQKRFPGSVVPVDYSDPKFESNQEHIALMERALERGVPVVSITPTLQTIDGNWYALEDEIPEGFVKSSAADFAENDVPSLSPELQAIIDS